MGITARKVVKMAEENELLMDEAIVDDKNAIDNLKNFLGEKIGIKLNRAQRRKLAKKGGKKGRQQLSSVTDTAKKLNYIDLIQKLRELNEKKEKENYEDANEDN